MEAHLSSYDERAYDRLFGRAIISESGCYEFTGHCNPDGYGNIRYKNIHIGAHRLAYMLCIGDIPKGMLIMHTCDNPPCVNPEHLQLGTQEDNVRDRVSKGRSADYSGLNNPRSKLDARDIARILELRTKGWTCEAIATVVGASSSHVNRICLKGGRS